MKRSILSVCILTLLCLLSCDINVLNDLLNEVRGKFLDESKDNKDLNHKQENQEQKEVVIDDLEEEVVEIQQDMGVKPVNAGFEVSEQVQPYYVKEEVIKIEEKDLVPSTDEESKAQEEIENVKRVLGDSEFHQLIEEARKLQTESKQLESDFYRIFSEFQTKLQEQRSISKSNSQTYRTKRQELIKLQNRFNEKRNQIDMFITQIDAGLNERSSAKSFFEQSQETLKEAITERLRKKKRRSYLSRKVDNDLVARQAQREAENALKQLESSSIKLIEAMGEKKNIEALIEEAKSYLSNFAR
ncbi:P12 family lipoprotein (plasmid) [Borrelia parkeri]|uniref:P12 family lipoprotein n=1 Tax=Borrelia parkeri TaxID=141 RepID=UPI001FF3FE10|nr:P12 family lipoprotein [Borrelia parkeri]UPA11693.1 P12 family lipoprotein [Borrelia parkeri]